MKVERYVLMFTMIFLAVGLASAENAVYDSNYGAPLCDTGESPCVANSSLLKSKDNLTENEPNSPNTLNGCSDGTSGTYETDENVENMTISTLDGTYINGTDTINVKSWVHCYGTDDNINLVYAHDADSPQWKIKKSIESCSSQGWHEFSWNVSIDDYNGTHAFRTVIQYLGDNTTKCGDGNYDDNDDVAFYVNSPNEAPPPALIDEETDQYVVDAEDYKVTVERQASDYWGMILDIYSKAYDPNDSVSDNYVGNYINIYKSSGGKWSLPNAVLTSDTDTITENGWQRGTIKYNWTENMEVRWYFYDEYYVGRLTTDSFTGDNSDGVRTYILAANDTNSTGGYDHGGLHWAEGPLGKNDTTVSTTNEQYDVFGLGDWVTWYGNLTVGQIIQDLTGSHSDSHVVDIEATGSDYFLSGWTGTDALATYDQMFSIVDYNQGNTSTRTENMNSVYRNPAVTTCVDNCTSSSYRKRVFDYKFQVSDDAQFNVTGNSSWLNQTEKIYLTFEGAPSDSSLYRYDTGWTMIKSTSDIQWNDDGTAVTWIRQPKDTTEEYYLTNDDPNVPPVVEDMTNLTSVDPGTDSVIHANISDEDGTDDLSLSNISCEGPTLTNETFDKSINDTPTYTDLNSTWRRYEYTVPFSKHAEPGEWTCEVYVQCQAGQTDTSNDTFTMNERVGVLLNKSLMSVSGSPGTSYNLTVMSIENDGNVDINSSVSGTDMVGVSDSSWEIGVGNLSYDGNSLSSTPVLVESNLPRANSFSNDWDVSIPSPLKDQDYQGTINYTAVKS